MCRCCEIVPYFYGSIEGKARKKINRFRRLFRSEKGVYYTAVEERIPGGYGYSGHANVTTCPVCGRIL